MRRISTRPSSTAPARRGSFLTGCLIVLAVLIIIAVIAGIWISANYRGWLANWTTQGVQAALDDSELSDEQKIAIMAEVEALALDYKEKRISERELFEVGKEIAESPLLPLGAVYAVDRAYVQSSEMPAEEKADAKLQLQRAARGFYEKAISQEQLEDILEPISKRQPADADADDFDVDLQEPENVTIEELRQFVERARSAADAADIPSEPYQIDIAAELRKAIDRALGRTPRDEALPPAPEPGAPAPDPVEEPGEFAPAGGG